MITLCVAARADTEELDAVAQERRFEVLITTWRSEPESHVLFSKLHPFKQRCNRREL
jgi:hypothetical protein